MLKRLWNLVVASFTVPGAKLTNIPEALERQETSRRNRERAVQIVTKRNTLTARIARMEFYRKELRLAYGYAQERNDAKEADIIRTKIKACEWHLAKDHAALVEVKRIIEEINNDFTQEEQELRSKTADFLRLKSQWLED